MTLVSGERTASDAVYKLVNGVIALGKIGEGTANITATPYGHGTGTAQTASLDTFWGAIPTSEALKENFGYEQTVTIDGKTYQGYRMLTPTTTPGAFPSSEDVTTHEINVNGTTCCSAVCQYGKLYHPASAAADAEETTYTTDKPACFIRTFTGSIASPNSFTIKANNLIQTGKVQVWWKDGNNWYDLSTAVAGSVIHSGTNTITKNILSSSGETPRPDMTIAIIVQPGATAIGAITASFA